MMFVETFVLASYFATIAILSVYSWHRYYLVYLYFRHRGFSPQRTEPEHLPPVTIQLPIYNEMYVVERLIEAACNIDYPRSLLEIQLLDDSTDDTREIAERAVQHFAAKGIDIKYYHRTDRAGYKAGALKAGLTVAKGGYIAIFDADFIPLPDFLLRVMPYFSDARVGMVQARWDHINEDHSWLTKIQAILLDAHFVLEHGGRNRSGRFFNFNGTAGVWRREAIESAGGWQHDTLTEDLDLSYRAQLQGWQFVFLPQVIAPAEVPVEMNGFKSQQHRWAKGSIQTCCKLLPRILRAKIPLSTKVEAFFHLTAHFNYPLILVLAVLMFPCLYVRFHTGRMSLFETLPIDLLVFSTALLSFLNFYATCQHELHRDWVKRMKYLPLLLAVAIGISVNNTRAVFGAFMTGTNDFVRTPKYGIKRGSRSNDWLRKRYRETAPIQPLIELTIGLYLTIAVFYALANHIYSALPFLTLFQLGFLYTAFLSIIQQYAGKPFPLRSATVPRPDEIDA